MNKRIRRKLYQFLREWQAVLVTVVSVSSFVILLRLLGLLEPFEWATLDILFQIRPQQPKNERIVIIGFDEVDLQTYQWPINDEIIAKLIKKTQQQNPKVIGLDIGLENLVKPGENELVKLFQSTSNLVAVKNTVNQTTNLTKFPEISPKLEQTGAEEVIVDRDRILRRYLLTSGKTNSLDSMSFGLKVALKYLEKNHIESQVSSKDRWIKIGDTVLFCLDNNYGSYINTQINGKQILLNYRNSPKSFTKVTFSDVLNNRVSQDLFKNKIVLIGLTIPTNNNFFYTSYTPWKNQKDELTYGVEIEASLVSTIVNAVIDKIPLIRVWEDWLEYLWIIFWIITPSLTIWMIKNKYRGFKRQVLIINCFIILMSGLLTISYFAFTKCLWIPVFPPFIGLLLSSISISLYTDFYQLRKLNQQLFREIELEQKKLMETQTKTEEVLQELNDTKHKLIFQARLANLGIIVLGVVHELKNPLNFIINFSRTTELLIEELNNLLFLSNTEEDSDKQLMSNHQEIQSILVDISDNLQEIETYGIRADELCKTLLFQGNPHDSETRKTNLNKLLKTNFKLLNYSYRVKYLDFSVDIEESYDSSLDEVEIIPSDVTEIFINLLDNAYHAVLDKYTRLGNSYSPKILVITQKRDLSFDIIVEDNGDGINREINDKLFEPFITTKPIGEGTGLGLYIIHRLISKNEGTIHWESEVGKFTRFIVNLPLKNDSQG